MNPERIGLDTSFLVAWAVREHPPHDICRQMLDTALAQGCTFGLTAGILAEFLYVITDPRRFAQPLTVPDATALTAFWENVREVTLLPQNAAVVTLWLHWMNLHFLGRKRLLDTLIAATWFQAGITKVFTLNPSDFAIFDAFACCPERQ